ncbi:MAG: hypothetical protein ACYDDV_05835 [Methanoregula sp.]
MDKKDILYMAGALCIILIIALVIKPIMTGQPVNTGIAAPTPQPTVIPVTIQNPNFSHQIVTHVTTIPVHASTPISTPVPAWNKSVTALTFVDPSTYGISVNQSIPDSSRLDEKRSDTNMTTYAKFSGQYSGTTATINIPFPYWELVYTVEPFSSVIPSKTQVIPTKGEGISYSGLQGSYSTESPDFSIQVMDGIDPNRIVRTISPPGGIDLNLWLGTKKSITNPQDNLKTNQKVSVSETKAVDPRPWTEKFYSGQTSYFFIINAHNLKSYNIEIRVPTRYI